MQGPIVVTALSGPIVRGVLHGFTGVGLDAGVAVGVDVAVGVTVGVDVLVDVAVAVGVLVDVGLGVGVNVGVGVGDDGIGMNEVVSEYVDVPPAAIEKLQLIPAPLS